MERGSSFAALTWTIAALSAGCTIIEVRTASTVETDIHLGQITVRNAGNDPVVIRQTTYGLQVTGQRLTLGYASDLTVSQKSGDERNSILVIGNVSKLSIPACKTVTIDARELQLCRILEDDN